MTKFEARLAKSNWSKALAEGRVVRFDSGASFKAFGTVEDARAFAAMLSHTDMSATIVELIACRKCGARSADLSAHDCKPSAAMLDHEARIGLHNRILDEEKAKAGGRRASQSHYRADSAAYRAAMIDAGRGRLLR